MRTCGVLGATLALACGQLAHASERPIAMSRAIWAELSEDEQATLRQRYVLEFHDADSFGAIFDAQGEDQSTAPTTGGAALGSAVGSAAYVDRALNGGSYSAKTHLATSIVGALLGSFIDSKGRRQYQFRYAVKLGTGQIRYVDETRSDPFRHPPGVCMSIPAMLVTDQSLCSQTVSLIRSKYLGRAAPTSTIEAPPAPIYTPVRRENGSGSAAAPDLILCRMGSLAPVQATPAKCEAIGGSVVK